MKTTYRINPAYEHLRESIEAIPEHAYTPQRVFCHKRNVVELVDIAGIRMVVKHFRRPNLINRFVYALFRRPKADRSFDNALDFRSHGFRSPEPVAVIARRSPLLYSDSWYISLYDPSPPLGEFITEADRPRMDTLFATDERLRAFVDFAVRLFSAEIYQKDFNRGNFLTVTLPEGGYDFSLVDINRVQRSPVTPLMVAMAFKKFGADRAPGLIEHLTREISTRLGYTDAEIAAGLSKYVASARRFDRTRRLRKVLKRLIGRK